MAKFDGGQKYKLTLQLEAQMPMIHFQSAQSGVTIRATEVKPKLDRYLLNKMIQDAGLDSKESDYEQQVKQLKKNTKFSDLFLNAKSDDNDGLDYKLQISVTDPIEEIELNKVKIEKVADREIKNHDENYSMFYGNMKKSGEEKKYGVFSNPTVTIICFKDELRKYIEQNIEKFFLVTNFGTMQDKGFGSFIPVNWCPDAVLGQGKKEEVAAAFAELIPGSKCFAMEFENLPRRSASLTERNLFCCKMSNVIKDFYSIMKTGYNVRDNYSRSYIYLYAHERLGMGNEKAWMKKTGVSPIMYRPGNEKKWDYCSEPYRYLRAFLGIGEQIVYCNTTDVKGNPKRDRNTDVVVKIESEKVQGVQGKREKKFERISSPIYFKVIRNVVFVVAFEAPEELYGTEFTFSSNMGTGTIKVPTREELSKTGMKFDMQDFLDCYVKYYNDLLESRKIPAINTKRCPKVKEVKPNA